MMGGRSRLRADNEQGPAYLAQQAFVTWGGRDNVSVTAAGSPVTLFFPFPVPAFRLPIVNFKQLVDVRYARPTTWAVNLFVEAQAPMDIGDTVRLLWNVNVSVGSASNRIQIETNFTKVAVPTAPAAQSTLVSLQVAAHTIQIIPDAMSAHCAADKTQNFAWSAWVAPVVD